MSRPIPLDIIPSHLYLSAEDQSTLFGIGSPLTVRTSHTQPGQVVYEECVEVMGNNKRSLKFRIMGPNWEQSHVELTPIEAGYLGLKPPMAKSGDLRMASPCLLRGPAGEVRLDCGVIIPLPHLFCSPDDANDLRVKNGDHVDLDVIDDSGETIKDVLVRVHPSFTLRAEIRADLASNLWLARSAHARVRFFPA
ncbi:MAG: PduL/EutD family phosphate acyltransferase [Patescibacteria group bacterium]|jgi:propanediol utilization protein